jgi:hypothetical protein
MSELAPSGGGPNRLFIILALGLGILLILGLIGLGGYFVLQNIARAPVSAPTAIFVASTPTREALATATLAPSPTLTEQPTPTFVLVTGGGPTQTPGGPTATATQTVSGAATIGTPSGQLPKSGLGEDLLLLAGGVVLVLIIFAARRARVAGV